MSTAKKKTTTPAAGAFDVAADHFETAVDMLKGGLDAAIDAGAQQARAAGAFEGVEFVGRENVDAALKAGEAYFANLKSLNELVFKTAKETVRFNTDAAKTLSGCKTAEDLTQAQMKIATGGFEAAMAAANTFGQAAAKAAGEVTQPLSAQFGTVLNTQPFAQFWTKTAA